jgi:hypothetical protein
VRIVSLPKSAAYTSADPSQAEGIAGFRVPVRVWNAVRSLENIQVKDLIKLLVASM